MRELIFSRPSLAADLLPSFTRCLLDFLACLFARRSDPIDIPVVKKCLPRKLSRGIPKRLIVEPMPYPFC